MTDRLISIFCILATSGITCLVSIASQLKDIVLFNNSETKRKCQKGSFYKILLILMLKWSNRATSDMPNHVIFYILSSKNRSRSRKNIYNFFTILENVFLCFIMPNFMVIAPRTIKLQPFIHSDPKCTLDLIFNEILIYYFS